VSVAVLNDIIYAMGGFDGYHRQSTAERYDYRRNQWSLIAPMNVQRSDASATALNGNHVTLHCRASEARGRR
jgi:kelch-like protein 10